MGNLILIIDDDEVDQFMLERMLRQIGAVNPIRKLSDGYLAIRYLNGDPPYTERAIYPAPSAIFLDLKMPGISGWDVLEWIDAVSMKRHAKIFVYSQGNSIPDLQRMYSLGADSFLSKPLKEKDLFNLVYHFPGPFQIERPLENIE